MIDRTTRLGTRARDMVSGFEGIITGRAEYLNGCTQFCLKPRVDDDGKELDGCWYDNGQLEVLDTEFVDVFDKEYGSDAEQPDAEQPRVEARAPGGPQRDAPRL